MTVIRIKSKMSILINFSGLKEKYYPYDFRHYGFKIQRLQQQCKNNRVMSNMLALLSALALIVARWLQRFSVLMHSISRRSLT